MPPSWSGTKSWWSSITRTWVSQLCMVCSLPQLAVGVTRLLIAAHCSVVSCIACLFVQNTGWFATETDSTRFTFRNIVEGQPDADASFLLHVDPHTGEYSGALGSEILGA